MSLSPVDGAEVGSAAGDRPLADAGWLDARRATQWIWFAAVGVVIMALGSIYSSYVDPESFGKILKPPDYMAFWTASVVLLEDGAPMAYDWHATHAIMLEILGVDDIGGMLPWVYPPHALPFVAPLGLTHPVLAGVIWVTVQIAVFLWACWKVLPHRLAVVGAFMTAPVLVTLVTGQAGLYWAICLVLAIEYRRRAPVWAGLALGFATMKPHLFVPLPLAFLGEGTVKALIWATVFMALLVVLSIAVGGIAVWQAFFDKVALTAAVHTHAEADYKLTASMFSTLLSWGIPVSTAGLVHGLLAMPCFVALMLCWGSLGTQRLGIGQVPEDIKAAMLCFALFAIGPRTMIYEMALLYVGILYQLRFSLKHGFYAGEKVLLLVLAIANVLSFVKVPGVFPIMAYVLVVALFFGRVLPALRRMPGAAMPA
ncbi:MAG: glycosyltransferase family 87 protein [Pseudomonadota bacterium]